METGRAVLISLVPILPLIGFLINGLGYKKIPKTLAGIIGSGSVLASFVITCILFVQVNQSSVPAFHITLFDFIHFADMKLSFSFLVDHLSILLMLVITGVGFLIHLYSTGYMHDDEGFGKYFAYLNLFIFSMLLLVMGDNYVVMFFGWEGVGFCSYLLIGFWFRKKEYAAAAKKAFVMNRIGDLGFLAGLFLMYQQFGSLNFFEVFSKVHNLESGSGAIDAICICLFIGACGKSAQIPLFTWLPDAMAGPTPVSALIHAATMVTAGIYMVTRSQILYHLSPLTLDIIAWTGALTAMVAALTALTQSDIKKVLAYSTVSQLGYMFVALGLGEYNTGIFHLMTHAFFKALLFLGAGSVIHAASGEQNIFKMGGLRKYMPITYITFFIGCLAIAGIPPFSGFFSKDALFMALVSENKPLAIFMIIVFVLTIIYMFRMFILTFHGSYRGDEHSKSHLHESPWSMTIPLIGLAILATFGGFINIPSVFHGGEWLNHYLNHILYPQPLVEHNYDHAKEWLLMGISVGVYVATIIALFVYYKGKNPVEKSEAEMNVIQRLSYRKFYLDEIYDAIIRKPMDLISSWTYSIIELKVIDGIVNGSGSVVIWFSQNLRALQTGRIGFYLMVMVIAVVCMLAVLLFS